MTVGPVLPAGNDGFEGVEAVKDYIRSAQKSGMTDNGKISAASARGIANRCNPCENPSSYRNCQRAALGAMAPLAALAAHSSSDSERVAAFDAIGMVLFGAEDDVAGTVVQDVKVANTLIEALAQALDVGRPVSQPERQAALHCMRSLATLESFENHLIALIEYVRAVLLDNQSLKALKADALSVFSSFATRPNCKPVVAAAMDAATLSVVMEELVPESAEYCLSFGLLVADILDFGLLESGDRFVQALNILQSQHGFLEHFHDALEASVHHREWPVGTNCFPSMPRMSGCALRLTELGMRKQLTRAAPSLLTMTETCEAAEEPALVALRQLAEVPSVFSVVAAHRSFLKTLESGEAVELLAYIERMHRTPIVWFSDFSALSQAARLMASQCHQSKVVDWRKASALGTAVTVSEEDALEEMRQLEVWRFNAVEGRMRMLKQAAWLWAADVPNAHVSMCFDAFKCLLGERQSRLSMLDPELSALGGEALTLRDGAMVCRGAEVLSYLAQKWGRHDLSGKFWCGEQDNPEEAKVAAEINARIEWLEMLHKVLLHGVIFPQVLPPEEAQEMDVYMEIHQARREAEMLLMELDADLASAQCRKGQAIRLCAGRLTLADFVAAAVLRVGCLIGQDWARYPNVQAYLDSLVCLPGYSEVFQGVHKLEMMTQKKVRARGPIVV